MPLMNVIKAVILGEGGVGKTTLLKRFSEGVFVPDTKMTIGAGFVTAKLMNSEDKEVEVQICATRIEVNELPGSLVMFKL